MTSITERILPDKKRKQACCLQPLEARWRLKEPVVPFTQYPPSQREMRAAVYCPGEGDLGIDLGLAHQL